MSRDFRYAYFLKESKKKLLLFAKPKKKNQTKYVYIESKRNKCSGTIAYLFFSLSFRNFWRVKVKL